MEKQNSLRRHRSGAEYPTSGQLTASSSAITPYRPLSSRFKLPPGWGIEQVLRSSGDRVDRVHFSTFNLIRYSFLTSYYFLSW